MTVTPENSIPVVVLLVVLEVQRAAKEGGDEC